MKAMKEVCTRKSVSAKDYSKPCTHWVDDDDIYRYYDITPPIYQSKKAIRIGNHYYERMKINEYCYSRT